jgi:iron complex outermembrane receptor protein
MSELVNARKTKTDFRFQLLATASAIVLAGAAFATQQAIAADDDSDRAPVWIELGGQLSRLDERQEAFAPPFMAGRPAIFSPSQKFESLPLSSIDEFGEISFEPNGSGWVLSASALYGRSSNNKHVHQQTHPSSFIPTKYGVPSPIPPIAPAAARFADTLVRNDESHLIVDFQAGKDVGLGMFGERGSSVLSLGVRFAQFQSRSNMSLKSDPDWRFHTKYTRGLKIARQPYHSNLAHLSAARSFQGVGPSLSWKASEPLMRDSQGSELAADWGLNVAILFGRQRTKASHEATGLFHSSFNFYKGGHTVVYQPTPAKADRARTITISNVGGFAGATWRIQNVKVSAGYRADLFFGAMDGGIDAAKKENVGFYGPFATISIGIGG